MSIGAVLVQPQRVRRDRGARGKGALLGDFANVMTRLAVDRKQGGHVGDIVRDAVIADVERIVQERAARIPQAAPHIVQALGKLAEAITGIKPNVRITAASDTLVLGRDILEHFAVGLEGVTAAQLRPHVAAFLAILENDIGLSFAQIENELWSIIDDVITRLEAAPPESDARAHATRLEVACVLRRLRHELRDSFTLPRLDADRIANLLVSFLASFKAPRFAEKLRCVASALDAAALTGQSIEELVPLGTLSEFRSLGAAAAAAAPEERYCWYASWLLGADVVINEDRTEIRKGSTVVARGENLTLKDIPEFKPGNDPHYTFSTEHDEEELETIAFGTAIGTDALMVFLHTISLEEGDYFSNLLNIAFTTFHGAGKIQRHRPLMPWWVDDWVISPAITTLTSFEGAHSKAKTWYAFVMWLTLFIGDFGEERLYRGYARTARNFILSLYTLYNHKKAEPGAIQPQNFRITAGVSDLVGFFTATIVGFTIPRDDWGFNNTSTGDKNLKLILGWWLTAATVSALFGRVAGGFLCWAIAGERAPVSNWITQRWWMLFEYWFWQIAFTYWYHDGNTNGGRYSVSGPEYAGFKNFKTSPYTLPYGRGVSRYVVQGNHGIVSHHKLNNNQAYAYDFSLDEDEAVLAARPGTVVDYFDWVADNTQNSTAADATLAVAGQTMSSEVNFIVVRHDRDEAGTVLAPAVFDAHDRDKGDLATRTYTTYLHGRKGSVREAFADRSIAAASIIGTEVKRGDWLMRSGSTGISAHNHLHIAVRPGADVNTVPVQMSTLGTELPFVFREVENYATQDGVPVPMNWYTAHPETVT